jgi:hypothetical protein
MGRVRFFNTDKGELPPAAKSWLRKWTKTPDEPVIRPRTVYGADVTPPAAKNPPGKFTTSPAEERAGPGGC